MTATRATRALAEHLVSTRVGRIPATISMRARLSILDWIAVTVGGSSEEASRIAADLALAEASTGPCTLVGRSGRTTAQLAALANGVASHALDFDDGSYWMMGHPSVAIVPAALAMAEARDSTGEEFVRAVIAGVDAASIVGVLVGKSHYMAGWHATGTIGTFGAAAAAATLVGLDVEQMQHALGLAATQAAGLKTMNGTMGKPFHAGRAAMSGVLAAQLAELGYTVDPDALESPQGFGWTASTTFNADAPAQVMGEQYGLEAVSYKRHACCGGTHPTIDTLRSMQNEHAFTATDVQSVQLSVSPMIASMCIVDVPHRGLEGKFSLRYCAALALTGRGTGPSAFTDEAVRDGEVCRTMDIVSTMPLDRTGPAVDIEVRLLDGRTITKRAHDDVPQDAEPVPRILDDELDETWAALTLKFDELVAPTLGGERSAELVRRLAMLDSEPSLRCFAALLRPD